VDVSLLGAAAALAALVGAFMAVTHRHTLVAALFLVLNLLSVAVLYVLLEAPFVAAVQVIVYAGAIMVLFLFIIMLLDLRHEEGRQSGLLQRFLALGGGAIFLLLLARGALREPPPADAAAPAGLGSPERVAALLFSDYLVPFEMISVLLLAALVGAVVVARRRGAP
jgi:NADH-quinone oxidoreductase subunit J